MRYAEITVPLADEKLIVIRYTTFYYHCPSTKTDRHDIAEILLKVALSTITLKCANGLFLS
jgi:hypothetical protein